MPLAETVGGPNGDGMVPVERPVHNGGSHLQHQMSTARPPAHLLLSAHSTMQQLLHRAFGDRRRDRFLASAACRVVDDDIGLSRNVRLKITQKSRHFPGGRGKQRCGTGGVHCSESFVDEIKSAPDLTMPETPTDSLDRLDKTSTGLAITLRGIRPALGRLGNVLNSHRQMKPVQHMMGWTGAGRFAVTGVSAVALSP
jgi:hypothetical protein